MVACLGRTSIAVLIYKMRGNSESDESVRAIAIIAILSP